LRWAELFQPAIELAEKGFNPTPRLREFLASDPFLQQ
jgi:gamma-glutamyltranspeptidase